MKCVLGGAVWDVREQHVMPTAVFSLSLCLSQLEDLKLTGGAADGWMLY